MRFGIFVIAVLVSGCGTNPTTQIAAFGNSTNAITGKVDAVMDEYNDAALHRKFTGYAAAYDEKHASKFTSEELAKINKPITPEQKKTFAIYKANKALGAYSKALSDLTTAGNRVDIDLAAANLLGSMTSLNEQYKTLKEKDNDLFDLENFAGVSKLVAAIGSIIVEEKRKAAIKGIVIGADKSIAVICDAIIKELETAKIEDSISASRQYVLSEEIIDYKSKLKGDTTLEWRRNEIKRLYSIQQDVFNSKLLVQQTIKAVKAVKQAHSTLAKELNEDRFTSAAIASAIGNLKDLEAHYDDFEALLLSCKKITKNDDGILSCDDK